MVLIVVTVFAAIAAVACIPLSAESGLWPYVGVGLFCGFALPLYSVCIAYTNDHLHPDQMIAASGTLVLVGGLGAVSGPLIIALLMDLFSEDFFFLGLAVGHVNVVDHDVFGPQFFTDRLGRAVV